MWTTRPRETPVDRAKRRAGYAAIVLVVLAAVSLTQAGAIAAAAPVDLLASAGAGDASAVTMASGLMLIAGTTALALAAAWMVWRTRSRVAICVGLGLVALNFVEYGRAAGARAGCGAGLSPDEGCGSRLEFLRRGVGVDLDPGLLREGEHVACLGEQGGACEVFAAVLPFAPGDDDDRGIR